MLKNYGKLNKHIDGSQWFSCGTPRYFIIEIPKDLQDKFPNEQKQIKVDRNEATAVWNCINFMQTKNKYHKFIFDEVTRLF